MATSKIKVINKTLKKAIDYITNPAKTDQGKLVYSYGCSVPTADLEMELTAKQGSGRGERLAYHLIQSFSPEDDISPEKALELGIEFAKKVTGGKFEFVVSTHIDKDQIHNHIIFNAVSYVDHKKYHSDIRDKYRFRDINDEICKANHLSVLPKYDGKRKKKYQDKHIKEKTTWASKLKTAIDRVVLTAETFDDFLFAMEMEGYEIKREKRKHIAFRAPGQEHFTRSKSIGDHYTEDAIRKRIMNKGKEPSAEQRDIPENRIHAASQKKQNKAIFSKRINLLVDLSKNIKAKQSKGYEQALVRSNINTLVKTMNFLIEHQITTSDDFQVYAEGKQAEYSLYRKDVNKIEDRLLDLSEKIKFTQNYKKNASVYYESKRVKNPAEFVKDNADQITLFKASQIYFERKHLNPKELKLSDMFEEYKKLKEEKEQLLKRSNSLKNEIAELDRVTHNIEEALGIHFEGTVENGMQPDAKRKGREETAQR